MYTSLKASIAALAFLLPFSTSLASPMESAKDTELPRSKHNVSYYLEHGYELIRTTSMSDTRSSMFLSNGKDLKWCVVEYDSFSDYPSIGCFDLTPVEMKDSRD